MKRKITEIIIHCSATREGQHFTAADIDRWHRAINYDCIGYHFVILLDGTIERGRPLEQIGAHCKHHNKQSIGICYIGGLDANGDPKDTRTPAQREQLRRLVQQLMEQFPAATLHGHHDFAAKACPCFDVRREL